MVLQQLSFRRTWLTVGAVNSYLIQFNREVEMKNKILNFTPVVRGGKGLFSPFVRERFEIHANFSLNLSLTLDN